MMMQRKSRSNLDLLLVFGPIPALVALAAAVAVQAVPLPTLLAIGIITYAGLVAGTMESRKGARKTTLVAPSDRPALELMDTVPLTVGPVNVSVAWTRGVCPLGFRPGSAWDISRDGRLTYPLCRPAVEALSPVLSAGEIEGLWTQAACLCPLADREVVFAVARSGWRERSAPLPGARGETLRSEERPAA